MPVQDHYQLKVWHLRPGDLVEIYRAETHALLASGYADANGHFTHTYLASLGAAYALTRETPGAQPWSALEAVTPGTYRILPLYGGYLMKCVIGGTTGATAPTNDYPHRQWGQSHSVAVPAYYGCIVWNKRRCWTHGTGSIVQQAAWPDGALSTWPWDRVVELCYSRMGRYALLDDGTVKYLNYYTPGQGNGGPDNGWAQVQALPAKIVKMWHGFDGIWLLDVNRQLHWIYDGSGGAATTRQAHGDNLLAANPGPYRCALPGSRYTTELGIVTDNGTFATNDQGATSSFQASYIAAGSFTGIEAIVANAQHALLAVTNQGTRIQGWETATSGGAVVDATLPLNDTAAILAGGWQTTTVQTRLGSRHTWYSVSMGSTGYEIHRVFGGMPGRPEDVQVFACGWGLSNTDENVLIVTPRGALTARSTYSNFWSQDITQFNNAMVTSPTMGTYDEHDPITCHANPIILDGDAVWHLVPAPAAIPATWTMTTVQQEAPVPQDGSVSGTITVDGAAAARQVLALNALTGGQARQVLGETTSDAGTGAYSLVLEDYTDPVFVVALDEAGSPWTASWAVALGTRCYPTSAGHTGLVYEVTVAGTTGGSEPVWPGVVGATVVDNDVTWQAVDYYRPLAHGPVHPVAV